MPFTLSHTDFFFEGFSSCLRSGFLIGWGEVDGDGDGEGVAVGLGDAAMVTFAFTA
jgi:hypothetical protein